MSNLEKKAFINTSKSTVYITVGLALVVPYSRASTLSSGLPNLRR